MIRRRSRPFTTVFDSPPSDLWHMPVVVTDVTDLDSETPEYLIASMGVLAPSTHLISPQSCRIFHLIFHHDASDGDN